MAVSLQPAFGSGVEPYLSVESFSHAEPVSVHAYATNWQGPLESGSNGMTHNWIETGARYGMFSVSMVQRLDYEVKASRDSAVFYYLVRNRLNLPVGTPFDLDLRIYHQRSRGLRLAYRIEPVSGLELEGGVSLLDAMRLTQGRLTGSARIVANKDYDYNAQVSYFYSRDALFGRPASPPAGQGYSLDLSARWLVDTRYVLSAQVRDFYGWLRWNDAPFTTATVTSATKQYGNDGYVEYSPTLSGFEGNANYRQRLHPRALLGADWRWAPQDTIGLRLRLTEVKAYASLRAERRYPGCLALNAELMPAQRALGVGASCGLISFSLLSDKLRFEDAHVLQLNAALAYRF